MSDDTTDAEREDAGREESNDGSGSGLRMLLLMGLSFIAGYLLGKSQGGEPNLHEELEDLGTDEGPMEIEISDTRNGSETESEDEATEPDADDQQSENGGEDEEEEDDE